MKQINILRGYIIKATSKKLKCAGRLSAEKNSKISVANGVVELGERAHLKENSRIIAVEGGKIIIGNGFGINRNSIIVAREKIVIGDNCSIGPNVSIYDHDHKFDRDGVQKSEYSSSSIVIGNNVWIGANTVILRGTVIGDCSVIGAGCVVKGTIPSHVIVTNNRSVVIRSIE